MREHDDLAWLLDCRKIEQIMYRFGRAVDNRSIEERTRLLSELMMSDIEMEYPFGRWSGRVECVQALHDVLSSFTFTHHVITNPIVDIDGNHAEASYVVTGPYGIADGRIFLAGSRYRQQLVRTNESWLIGKHICHDIWLEKDADDVFNNGAGAALAEEM